MELEANLADIFKNIDRDSVEFNKKCAKITQEISSGETTIIQLVEQLGPLLVGILPDDRAQGTWILTHVLEQLPPNHLDKNQLTFICAFYTDRLKDNYKTIPAVLKGFLALTTFEQFPEGAAAQFCLALFQHVSCQQQQQQDRNNIYRIFEQLLTKCKTELQALSFDFVYGVISAVDGERDPKNLILLFNWFPQFLKSVHLGHLIEEAFEILACYFPVEFKASEQDPNGVTRDKLANSLAPCLVSIPQFAEFCLPLALDKLDSSLELAKLDSLQLLQLGCLNFDTSAYLAQATQIWSQIQKELFNNPTSDVESMCLTTLAAVIKKISPDPNQTVADIAATVKRNLLPDSKLFEPSWKLLLSVAGASLQSCDLITSEIAPILINTFNITTAPAQKAVILTVLVRFFDCYVTLHDKIEFEELNTVPVLCMKGALDGSDVLQSAAFIGLRKMARFLKTDVRISLYDYLSQVLVLPRAGEVRLSLINCFRALAELYPVEVKEKLLDSVEITDEHSLELFLNALAAITSLDRFVNYASDCFLHYLRRDASLAEVALKCLRNLLETDGENNKQLQTVLFDKQIINTLVDWCLANETCIRDRCCLADASVLAKTIIGKQSSDTQAEILRKQMPKIDLSKQNHLFLLSGLLCNLRQDVALDYSILSHLTDLALTGSDDLIKDGAAQLIANLVNKCNDEIVLQSYLSRFDDKSTSVRLSAWITKALVMRNHERANVWTDKMFELLLHDIKAAAGFGVIVNDNYDILSTKSYCNRTLLFQQKFFIIVSNKLSEGYRPDLKSYLLALGYLLEHVPRQAILLQFKKILKLFILCLDECDDSQVLVVLLETIKDFIVEKEPCIEDNLKDFLSRLLKLSLFEKSMKVRLLALLCLQLYADSFPVYKLLPHKTEVLKVLGQVIDDKKRMVRREAVEARSVWFLLDAPE